MNWKKNHFFTINKTKGQNQFPMGTEDRLGNMQKEPSSTTDCKTMKVLSGQDRKSPSVNEVVLLCKLVV